MQMSRYTFDIMLAIVINYPWTTFAVITIGAITRRFLHMVAQISDHTSLLQEAFVIDTWRAVIHSLGHCCKHMLMILPAVAGSKPECKK